MTPNLPGKSILTGCSGRHDLGGRSQGWQSLARIQPAHGWAGSRGRHAPLVGVQRRCLWAGIRKGGTPFASGYSGVENPCRANTPGMKQGFQGTALESLWRGHVAKQCITSPFSLSPPPGIFSGSPRIPSTSPKTSCGSLCYTARYYVRFRSGWRTDWGHGTIQVRGKDFQPGKAWPLRHRGCRLSGWHETPRRATRENFRLRPACQGRYSIVTVRRRRMGWQPRREVDLVERTC